MDPIPGSSSAHSEDTCSVSDEIHRRIESIKNLEDQFHVQHGFFKWSVENFSVFPGGDGISCYSPNFELEGTWWYLALCPSAKHCGRDGISLRLIRHERDPGPENVVSSYTLGLENSLSKIWFKAKENIVFKKGDHDGLQTSVLGNLQNFLSEGGENNEDTLSVVCEIYVSYLWNRTSKSASRISPVDQSLSSDLVDLFKRQKKFDVLIEIRNYHMWAHKSILCARSRTLARLLENGKCFIQLSCNFSCLNCLILYMYSGSFDYLARNASFSIGLYEMACELSLSNLRDMLTPYVMELKSRMEVRCFKKTCTIYGFDLVELCSHNVETPVGFDKESGMSVKIVLYKIKSPCECVGINIEVGGVARVFHVNVNVSFLNKNCEPFRDVTAEFLPDSHAEFRDTTLFSSFVISNADILSSVTNGNLFINVECTKYFLRNRSDLPANLSALSCDCKNWINELSADLKKMFKTGKLSDITLIVESERFKVHRSILAARSRFFYSLFYENNYLKNVLEIRDTEPRIIWIMLTHIYCGTISHIHDLTMEDFTKLYKVSAKCKIQSLVDICAQFLDLLR